MSAKIQIGPSEFQLMQDYIERSCGITITSEKMYLVETRLTTLMVESNCQSFTELYLKVSKDTTNTLRDKIIDAMTTNETLWFRDKNPFDILTEVLLDKMAEKIQNSQRTKIQIWSSACSTGQEPYSIAISILEYIRNHPFLKPEHFNIIGTDISPTVLFLALSGRYDHLAISRGLPDEYKYRYFESDGKVWVLKKEVKNMVTFKKINLLEDFSFISRQDIIFCRNVLIYFSDEVKKSVLKRLGELLRPDGYLMLGAAESIINYTKEYKMLTHHRGLYYKIKE